MSKNLENLVPKVKGFFQTAWYKQEHRSKIFHFTVPNRLDNELDVQFNLFSADFSESELIFYIAYAGLV